MPISDTGYRHWDGKRRGRFWRSVTIAKHGVTTALKKRGLLVVIFLAIIPAFVMGVVIYQAAQFLDQAKPEQFLKAVNGLLHSTEGWKRLVGKNPDIPTIWRVVFNKFMVWQLIPVMVLVTWIGPWLIARDLRVRALQIYFSRPLSLVDYILGKFMVIGTFIGMITVLPGLLLYVMGVLMARSLDVVVETWTIPVMLVLSAAAFTLVLGAIVLACSSMSRRTGIVASAWVSIVILSHVAYKMLTEAMAQDWAHLVSLWANAQQMLSWMFDVPPAYGKIVGTRTRPEQFIYGGGWSAVILAAVFLVSMAVLAWRIRTVEGEH